MDFETMKYYVSTGLWPQERIEKLFKKKRRGGNSQIPKMRGKQMEKSLGQVRARKWQKMR